MENGIEYLILGDMLLDAVVRACHMKWDDNEMLYRDINNQLMDWDDFISYAISIDDIIQVNIWGDGTIEFQSLGFLIEFQTFFVTLHTEIKG